MADEIIIEVTLEPTDIPKAGQEIARQLTNALDAGVSAARDAGQKIGQALGGGIQSGIGPATQQLKGLKSAIDSSTQSVSSLRSALGALGISFSALGAVEILKSLAETAVQAAINIDKSRQAIAALSGSVDAANAKIAQLRQLAASSPGVTTSFAVQLYQQFRALGNLSDQVIKNLIQSVGKLNSIFSIQNPTLFSTNLTQIFNKGFDIQDIRQALAQVPIFNQLLQEAFGTSDPAKLRQLKAAGKLTLQTFLSGIAEAVDTDPRFANIQESFGAQIDKLGDRFKTALAPFGDDLLKTALPVAEKLIDLFEQRGAIITEVFDHYKESLKQSADGLVILLDKTAQFISLLNIIDTKEDVFRKIGFDFSPIGVFAQILDRLDPSGGVFPRGSTGQAIIVGPNSNAGPNVFGSNASAPTIVNNRRQILDINGNVIGTVPRSPTDTTGPTDAQARALRNAQIALVKQLAEDSLKIEQDANKRGVDDLKDAFDRNKITLQDYYQFKQNLEVASLEHELRGLEQEAAAITKSLEAAKGPERFRDQAKLDDVLTQEQLIRGKILDTIVATGRELKKNEVFQPFDMEQLNLREVPVIDTEKLRLEKQAADLRRQAQEFGVADLEIQRQQLQIQDAVNHGLLTEGEARQAQLEVERQFRDILLESLKAQEALTSDPQKIAQIELQIDQVQRLGVEFSNAESFAHGFNSQIESTKQIFDQFGQSVAKALTNTKDLLGGLKNAIVQFFNDLLGQSLQNVVRQVLSPIDGLFGVGGQGGTARTSGIGSVFRTPSTFPASLTGLFGGGSVPPSISQTQRAQQFFTDLSGGDLLNDTSLEESIFGRSAGAVSTAATSATVKSGFSLGGLLDSLSSAAPFIGGALGASLGGQSGLGQILGAGAGIFGGLFATSAGTLVSAGGLGALTSSLGLLTLGPLAGIGAALAVGAVLLSNAKQRHADEEASGQMLTQALNAIDQLANGIASDQIDGSQAQSIFDTQILATFKQQIGTLKTASVRESRLKNQVQDLQNVYQARIVPLIADQQERKRVASENALRLSQQVPEFARGGIVPGFDTGFDSVAALMRPGEMVLTRGQQSAIAMRAGGDIFSAAGVPGVQPHAAFAGGGIVPSLAIQDQTININLQATLVAGRGTQEAFFVNAGQTENGRRIIVNGIRATQLRKE